MADLFPPLNSRCYGYGSQHCKGKPSVASPPLQSRLSLRLYIRVSGSEEKTEQRTKGLAFSQPNGMPAYAGILNFFVSEPTKEKPESQ